MAQDADDLFHLALFGFAYLRVSKRGAPEHPGERREISCARFRQSFQFLDDVADDICLR